MDKQQSVNLLSVAYQGCEMGVHSVEDLSCKVKDPLLKGQFNRMATDHKNLETLIAEQFNSHNAAPIQMSGKERAALWSTTKLQTLFNHDTEHIAEMMLDGSNMGIKAMTRAIKANPSADQSAKDVANEFIEMGQRHVEELKSYI